LKTNAEADWMNATRRAATGKSRANLVDQCYWKQTKDEKTTALYRMTGVDRAGWFAELVIDLVQHVTKLYSIFHMCTSHTSTAQTS
jgi:hypothetical protein